MAFLFRGKKHSKHTVVIAFETVDMIPTKITFRLQPEEAKRLYYWARDEKVSPHQKARDMVIDHITLATMEGHLQQMAQEVEDLREGLQDIEKALVQQQQGLIDALAVIISNVAKVETQEAKNWVEGGFQNAD